MSKKLTPLKFRPQELPMPWGSVEYRLADLGFVDSTASEGYLKGNTLSDIMQTYLERVVGEAAFDWYGTQFPVLVKRLVVKGRNSLHVNPDDETAEQRYDAFGKTAVWYVQEAGPEACLYLGFARPVSSREFYRACMESRVEELLHQVRPVPGQLYLIPPGVVHAAKDVTLLEIAECSELWFRLHEWGSTERELHLEEAFDLVDLGSRIDAPEGEVVRAGGAFTVHSIPLTGPLRSHREGDGSYLVYVCARGSATLREGETNYAMGPGELVLVPAEVTDFYLAPDSEDTLLLEVRTDPRE